MADMTAPVPYPVRLDVEYPAAQSRWRALLRLPLAVPLLIFTYFLSGYVVLAIWAAILVRGRFATLAALSWDRLHSSLSSESQEASA